MYLSIIICNTAVCRASSLSFVTGLESIHNPRAGFIDNIILISFSQIVNPP